MARWKKIEDFPNYEISSIGQVKNITTGKILKPGFSDGYEKVNLCHNKKATTKKIHHLVLESFVGKRPPNLRCSCHYDGNKRNNNIKNLRWGTDLDNTEDKIRHGRIIKGLKHHEAKLTPSIIKKCRLLYARGQSGNSLARIHGVCNTTMHRALSGESWSHVK